ncbi:chlorohydrolase [Streptococcus pneumoniae]|nr:chlorohydrolase [Streptococcus pneumoniae]
MRTDEVSNHTYGKVTLTWFEEILEEYCGLKRFSKSIWFEEIFEEYKN